ncbi:MAG TPA: NUDIX domain-containing protein, partial [Fimbriimonas sp.]
SARREVEEEVGYVVRDLHFVQRFLSSPGITSEMLHVFFAEVRDEDRVHGGNLLQGEDLLLEELSLPAAWAMLESGQIRDAKTLVGLQWLRLRR